MHRTIVLLFLAIFSSAAARAEEADKSTVQTLLAHCKTANNLQYTQCAFYIRGVAGMMATIGDIQSNVKSDSQYAVILAPFGVCYLDTVTVGQTIQVFINWAEKNPKEWQKDSAYGVWLALKSAWPCRANK